MPSGWKTKRKPLPDSLLLAYPAFKNLEEALQTTATSYGSGGPPQDVRTWYTTMNQTLTTATTNWKSLENEQGKVTELQSFLSSKKAEYEERYAELGRLSRSSTVLSKDQITAIANVERPVKKYQDKAKELERGEKKIVQWKATLSTLVNQIKAKPS